MWLIWYHIIIIIASIDVVPDDMALGESDVWLNALPISFCRPVVGFNLVPSPHLPDIVELMHLATHGTAWDVTCLDALPRHGIYISTGI